MSKHINGLLASVAMQCVEPDSGKVGTWLYSGESHRNPGSAKTPVFPDFYELCQWMRVNGWTQIGAGSHARYIYHDFNDKAQA